MRDAGAPDFNPRDFGGWVYARRDAILKDDTGANARRALRGKPHAAAVRLAAQGFRTRRAPNLRSYRSRVIVALYVLAYELSRSTTRRGYTRKTEGFTVRMWAALFPAPHAREDDATRPRSFFDASSWGADRKGPDEAGILVVLDRAGALSFGRPPLEKADPRYIGPPVRCRDGVTRRFPFVVIWFAAATGPP